MATAEGAGARAGSGAAGGPLPDAFLFLATVGLLGALLVQTLVLPNAREAARAEAAADRLERDVDALGQEVLQLRAEVLALQSDPPYIERMLRRRMRELRPHHFRPQVLPER